MNNTINDPYYTDVVAKWRKPLLQEKKRIGNTDEKYPDLVKVRSQVWK